MPAVSVGAFDTPVVTGSTVAGGCIQHAWKNALFAFPPIGKELNCWHTKFLRAVAAFYCKVRAASLDQPLDLPLA